MTNDEHHRGALIETAREELERAHRGVLALDAGEVRRGLQIASTAMQDAVSSADTTGTDPARSQLVADASAKLAKALVDLDDGSLSEMGLLIEDVRAALADATPIPG